KEGMRQYSVMLRIATAFNTKRAATTPAVGLRTDPSIFYTNYISTFLVSDVLLLAVQGVTQISTRRYEVARNKPYRNVKEVKHAVNDMTLIGHKLALAAKINNLWDQNRLIFKPFWSCAEAEFYEVPGLLNCVVDEIYKCSKAT
ncbi:hypothetical protein J6590_090841, partial [Homalodisca vitripennis]